MGVIETPSRRAASTASLTASRSQATEPAHRAKANTARFTVARLYGALRPLCDHPKESELTAIDPAVGLFA